MTEGGWGVIHEGVEGGVGVEDEGIGGIALSGLQYGLDWGWRGLRFLLDLRSFLSLAVWSFTADKLGDVAHRHGVDNL